MATQYSPQIVTNGLVLALDAGNIKSYQSGSSTWFDKSGNNYNGTLTNGPTFSTGSGGSIVFDGTNDYVDVADGFANFTAGVTIEAFVYPTNNNFYSRIMDFGNAAASDNILLSRYGTSLETSFWIFNGGSGTFITSTGNAFPLNSWQHWVAIANGTNFILYKNGVQNNITSNSVLPNNLTRISNFVGRSNWGDPFYGGNIAVLRMYNKALTAQEVLQNYNTTKGRFGL